LLSHDSNAQQLASQSLLFNFKKPLATDATEVDQTTCYLMALLSPSQRSSQLIMTPLRPGYLMTPRRISSEVLTKPQASRVRLRTIGIHMLLYYYVSIITFYAFGTSPANIC